MDTVNDVDSSVVVNKLNKFSMGTFQSMFDNDHQTDVADTKVALTESCSKSEKVRIVTGAADTAADWSFPHVSVADWPGGGSAVDWAKQHGSAGLLLPFTGAGQRGEVVRPPLLLGNSSSYSNNRLEAAVTAGEFHLRDQQQLAARSFVASLQANGRSALKMPIIGQCCNVHCPKISKYGKSFVLKN
jgi:hypothetical protein